MRVGFCVLGVEEIFKNQIGGGGYFSSPLKMKVIYTVNAVRCATIGGGSAFAARDYLLIIHEFFSSSSSSFWRFVCVCAAAPLGRLGFPL